MSEYTNVYIQSRFDTITQLRERIYDLECKNKWLNQMLDSYEKELHNIPKAIEKFGYVDIEFEKQRMKIGKIP